MELSKRQMMLFNLLQDQRKYYTIDEISKCLGVSKRTIHYELGKMESFFIQNNKKLRKKRGVGIKIIDLSTGKNDNLIIMNYSRLTVEQRRLDILYQLLFKERVITHNELAENYFVSKSSIKNDLNFINRNFIKLTSDHDGTYISEQEKKWQDAHLKFNQHIMLLDDSIRDEIYKLKKYYPKDIVCLCCNAFLEYIHNNSIVISDLYVQNIQNILVILMYRLRKGNHHSNIEKLKIEVKFNIRPILKLVNKVAKDLQVKPNKDDIKFLFNHLFLNRFNINKIPNINYEKITKELIGEMEKLMELPFKSDKLLYKQLLLHIPPMLTRLHTKNYIVNPLIQEIKKELILIYNILLIAIKNLEEYINVSFNEDKVAFLALYFQVAQERIQIIRRILVVCPMGIAASELLINRIKRVIPPKNIIQSASIAELENLDLDQFDFIFSTADLKDITHKWFKISLFVNEQDVMKLLNITKSEYHKYKSRSDFLILDLPQSYYRFVSMDASNKQQILQQAINGLISENIVSEKFLMSVLDREKLSSTDLPVGVATPHGLSDYINETAIIIIKNKKKIKWDSYYVDIIFLICIAKEDTLKTKEIISNIYNMINDPIILDKLRSST